MTYNKSFNLICEILQNADYLYFGKRRNLGNWLWLDSTVDEDLLRPQNVICMIS